MRGRESLAAIEVHQGRSRMHQRHSLNNLKHAATPCLVLFGVIFLVHSLRLMHPTSHKVTHTRSRGVFLISEKKWRTGELYNFYV